MLKFFTVFIILSLKCLAEDIIEENPCPWGLDGGPEVKEE